MWLLLIILALIALLLFFVFNNMRENLVPITFSFSINNPDPTLQYNFAFAPLAQTSDPSTWAIKYNNVTTFPLNLSAADSLTLSRTPKIVSAAAQAVDPTSGLSSPWTIKTIDISGTQNYFNISISPKVGDTTFSIGITVPDTSLLTSDAVVALDIFRTNPNNPNATPFELVSNTIIGTNGTLTVQGSYPDALLTGDILNINGIIRNATTVIGSGQATSVQVVANAPAAPDFTLGFGNYTSS